MLSDDQSNFWNKLRHLSAELRLLAMKSHMQKLNKVNKQRVMKFTNKNPGIPKKLDGALPEGSQVRSAAAAAASVVGRWRYRVGDDNFIKLS